MNCAALPESLIESELFGYVPGAFTGALTKGKKGLIQHADGGTLFLDEIGDMPMSLQARLLRVLSEHEVLPIGADRSIPVKVRVIAATHRDLVPMIRAGKFRQDLYYRLNGAVLTIPPLREREDFDWLLERLISQSASQYGKMARISEPARNTLRAYCWPGNIRELVNAIDFAQAVSESDTIQIEDLPEAVLMQANVAAVPKLSLRGQAGQSEEAANLCNALIAHRWNISATARFLGVDRTTVHRRMKRLGVVPPNLRKT